MLVSHHPLHRKQAKHAALPSTTLKVLREILSICRWGLRGDNFGKANVLVKIGNDGFLWITVFGGRQFQRDF